VLAQRLQRSIAVNRFEQFTARQLERSQHPVPGSLFVVSDENAE
jgi:hypothetical protein